MLGIVDVFTITVDHGDVLVKLATVVNGAKGS